MRLDTVEAISSRRTQGEAVDGGGRMADLYRTHSPAAFRVAYLVTGDKALAEDLTHEAFIKVIGRFHDLRDRGSFGAYLRTAVINLAHSHFRRARVERDYVRREAQVSEVVEHPRIERSDELRRALLRLPIRQRVAIVLRYYEDLSEHQTADAMGVSPGAVKSLVARGMERLREAVAAEGFDHPSGGET